MPSSRTRKRALARKAARSRACVLDIPVEVLAIVARHLAGGGGATYPFAATHPKFRLAVAFARLPVQHSLAAVADAPAESATAELRRFFWAGCRPPAATLAAMWGLIVAADPQQLRPRIETFAPLLQLDRLDSLRHRLVQKYSEDLDTWPETVLGYARLAVLGPYRRAALRGGLCVRARGTMLYIAALYAQPEYLARNRSSLAEDEWKWAIAAALSAGDRPTAARLLDTLPRSSVLTYAGRPFVARVLAGSDPAGDLEWLAVRCRGPLLSLGVACDLLAGHAGGDISLALTIIRQVGRGNDGRLSESDSANVRLAVRGEPAAVREAVDAEIARVVWPVVRR